MACILTQGFTLDCKDAIGGVKALYLVEFSALSSATLAASGEITALTLASGKSFFKYELPKGTANMEQTIQTSIENGTTFYESAITFQLHKLATEKRNEFKLLAQNRTIVIARDNNDNYWLNGWLTGCEMTAGGATTGTAWGDFNGHTATLLHREAEPPAKLTAGVVTSLGLT